MEVKVCRAEKGRNKDAESKQVQQKNSLSGKYKEGNKSGNKIQVSVGALTN